MDEIWTWIGRQVAGVDWVAWLQMMAIVTVVVLLQLRRAIKRERDERNGD